MRRRLVDLEFVPRGRPLDAKLAAGLDAATARFRALADAFADHEAAGATIQWRYRRERETLGLRWSTQVLGASGCAR